MIRSSHLLWKTLAATTTATLLVLRPPPTTTRTASALAFSTTTSSFASVRSSRGGGGDRYNHNSPINTSLRAAAASSSSSSALTNAQKAAASSTASAAVMQHMLQRIRAVNNVPAAVRASLWTFSVDGVALGKVTPSVVRLLCDTKVAPSADDDDDDDEPAAVFCVHADRPRVLTISDAVPATPCARTAAVGRVMERLGRDGTIPAWRDEWFPVAASFDDEPLFLVERAAVPFLGVLEYGVHMNGLIKDDDDDTTTTTSTSTTLMWMARRSATKSKYPGMLDHVVAGGQPAGLSLYENAVKECAEEAGIPAGVAAAGLVPVGAVSYESYHDGQGGDGNANRHDGGKRDTISRVVLFNYDLYLPSDFVPRAVDGEVQEFFTWTVDQLLASMAPDYDDPIKPNCYLVIIDWLLRAGYLSPDTPGYLDVLRELRSGDCQ